MSWFKKIFPSEEKSSEQKNKAVKKSTKDLSSEHKKETSTGKKEKDKALKELVGNGILASDKYLELSDELRNDKDICEALIKETADLFQELPEHIKFDKELVKKACSLHPDDIDIYIFVDEVSTKFEKDKELCRFVWDSMDKDTRSLSLLPQGYDEGKTGCILFDDKEFMLEVVKDSNKNYLFVGDTLKGDQELLGMVGADSYNDFIEHYEEYKTETHGTDEDEDDVIEIP